MTRRLVVVSVCAVLAAAGPASMVAAGETHNVLVLASRDSQQPAYEQFMSGFRAGVNGRAGDPVELFTEFLDSFRFPQAEHRMRMRRLLQGKYADTRIDLIISTSPFALDFVLEYRTSLFPEVPVVYALVSNLELPPRPLPTDVIGIVDRFDLAKTLDMARRLQPNARRVVIVTGADTFDEMWEKIARRELRTDTSGVVFDHLSGLPLPRLLEEVGRLPRDTIVLFLSVFRDGAGQTFRSPDVAQRVAAGASAPVYSVFPSYFGLGLVGGYMNSFEAVGAQTAAVALRLLSGESPGQLRAALGPEGAYLADWRQLQRWDLSESRLPVGSIVRFREQSAWESYRWYIVGGATLIVIQALLISSLLLQRAARRHAERDVQRTGAALAHASALSVAGELTASISHEINQPLGAILSNTDAAELLLDSGTARVDELRQVLQDIRKDDLRASDVVGRMRRLLRKHEAELLPCNVDEIAAEVLTLVRADADRRRVDLIAQFDGPNLVQGDRVHLQQVLLNLIMNAMDAVTECPAERRHVRVRTMRSEDRVEVVVADAGCGIADDAMPQLFNSFFSTKPQGMGLGLSIARSIVEAHGGRIWAEHNLGAPGDSLPLRAAPNMSATTPVVHVVDDDESFRTAVVRLLRAAGYEARAYASAGDFLLTPPGPDAHGCLVLDVRMPGPSGLDLQEALNRSSLALPVIFLTGHADVPSSVRAMKAGAADFLTKPVERQALLAAVQNAIERDARARSARNELATLRARLNSLSARERQVFDAVVAGQLNKQIAADLGAAERTVKAHRARVMEKMAAASLAELVHFAERLRIEPQ